MAVPFVCLEAQQGNRARPRQLGDLGECRLGLGPVQPGPAYLARAWSNSAPDLAKPGRLGLGLPNAGRCR